MLIIYVWYIICIFSAPFLFVFVTCVPAQSHPNRTIHERYNVIRTGVVAPQTSSGRFGSPIPKSLGDRVGKNGNNGRRNSCARDTERSFCGLLICGRWPLPSGAVIYKKYRRLSTCPLDLKFETVCSTEVILLLPPK